jgi:hypothetical protein
MLAMTALALALAANPELDEARALYKALHYAEAVPLLKRAAEAPGATLAERREAYDLLARAWAAEADLQAAEAAYGELLSKDAYAPAPVDAAPKLREVFRAAKAALYPPGTVRLTRRTATTVELFDPWGAVARVEARGAPQAPAPVISTAPGAAVVARGANGELLASIVEQPLPAAPHLPAPAPRPARAAAETPEPAVAPEPPPSPAPQVMPPAPEPVLVLVEARPTWRWPVSIACGLLGVVAGGVATGLGITAQNDASTVQKPPPTLTQRDVFSLAARQRTEATAANALIVTAALFALAGVLVFIFGPTE